MKLQKSKTLTQSRLSGLSTISENLKAKTGTPKYGSSSTPHAQPSRAHNNGEEILLFSAVANYRESVRSPELSRSFSASSTASSDHDRGLVPETIADHDEQSSLVVPVGDSDWSEAELCLQSPIDRITDKPEELEHEPPESIERISIQSQREMQEDEEYWTLPAKASGYEVDQRDLGTEDRWVARHPDLIRLIGDRPFNSEPPVTTLMHHRFLTPTPLHFVRNHGAVPHTAWESWRIEITGELISKPRKLTMRDLLSFPSRRLPVTIMCSGNRSQEMNIVGKKTVGLAWGAGAVSTSVWGGTRLCDVIRHCGLLTPKKRSTQYYVYFQGADKVSGNYTNPSFYGTSIALEVAMDESRDVLLAYEQNGDLLTPDHGFPVRLVVPGYAGEKMVKWLNRIEVSAKQLDKHKLDSRMLPSHIVSIEMATAEGWFDNTDGVINEMNVNSAVSAPGHRKTLTIDSSMRMVKYTIEGYAYSGGGKKIVRVEISFDEGETWEICKIQHPERSTKYGMHWCWCFWEYHVDMIKLTEIDEIIIRAWDSTMNTQPEHCSWNLLGMMNNCCYRVKVIQISGDPQDESCQISFEHPSGHSGYKLPGRLSFKDNKIGDSSLKREIIHTDSFSSLDLEDIPTTAHF